MGQWVKVRKPISKYPLTPQQKKVKVGGKLIKECKGLKNAEFRQCRREALSCAFNEDKCTEKFLSLKRKLLEEETKK